MTDSINKSKRNVLTIWTAVFCVSAMGIFALDSVTQPVSAGDTWLAIGVGRYIFSHGITAKDPFSFNSIPSGPTSEELDKYPKWSRPMIGRLFPDGWINQNWLTHLVFFVLSDNFGLNALVVWKAIIYILVVICLYYTSRLCGANPLLAVIFACFAVFVGKSFHDIRPQGFSNLLVPVYLLILTLTVRRNIKFIWLAPILIVLWANVHGGYIYVFIMSIPFVFLNFLTIKSKVIFYSIGRRGISHVVLAMIVSFFAMVIFNPYHFTNLTHTFVISVSKQAELWRTVAEWNPAFDWSNRVGTAVPFLIIFIASIIICVLWMLMILLKPKLNLKATGKKNKNQPVVIEGDFCWSKIDLSLIVIVLLTTYMAVKSRRFIPIAAFALAPVLAMMTTQIVQIISAKINLASHKKLYVSSIPNNILGYALLVLTISLILTGYNFWSSFKTLYLNPSPRNYVYDSIFMRMTTSFDKPFSACQFMKLNRFQGRIIHPWTEGGFLMWAQDEDNMSRTLPLKLFIDGRAQAAYTSSMYVKYMELQSGGPAGWKIHTARGPMNKKDLAESAAWIDKQLRFYGVAVCLISIRSGDRVFLTAIQQIPEWKTVYIDDRFLVLVDSRDANGKRIYDSLRRDALDFPNDFSRWMIMSFSRLANPDKKIKQEGLRYLEKALKLSPSPIILMQGAMVVNDPELSAQFREICRYYLEDLNKNADDYKTKNGFDSRIETAHIARKILESK